MPDWRLRCLRRHRRIKKRIQSYYSQANDFTGISSSDTFSCYRLAFFIFPDQTSIAENVLLHISSERNQPLFFFSLYFWYMIDACFHRLNSYFLSMRCPFMLQWSDLHWEECMTIICICQLFFFLNNHCPAPSIANISKMASPTCPVCRYPLPSGAAILWRTFRGAPED